MCLAQFFCSPQFFKTPKELCGHTVHTKFQKIGSGIEKLIMGETQIHTQIHREEGDFVCLLLFFKMRKIS
jgi:hypothetical protein